MLIYKQICTYTLFIYPAVYQYYSTSYVFLVSTEVLLVIFEVMIRNLLSILIFFISFALVASKKDSLGLSISAGLNFSTINTDKDFVSKPRIGNNIRLGVYLKRNILLSAEYTHFAKHDISIFEKKVQSQSLEINANFRSNLVGYSTAFYFITGVAMQNRIFNKVTYDAFNYGLLESSNVVQRDNWYGINLGFGLSQKIKFIDVFADLKYRISKRISSVPVNIIDIGYQIGLRYNFMLGKPTRKVRMKLPGDKYHWF
ncbi:MAG: hypothetical protein J0M08_07820 [Bacteroidetes bacterium]|nr:hypothetical protein [Bacteroidota bacterium]